jgi:hypothetical protein
MATWIAERMANPVLASRVFAGSMFEIVMIAVGKFGFAAAAV